MRIISVSLITQLAAAAASPISFARDSFESLPQSYTMALQFVVGDKTFNLSKEDLDKHPGSMLQSLIGSVSPSDHPVSFKVDALPDSPLATWPAAVGITTALYR